MTKTEKEAKVYGFMADVTNLTIYKLISECEN